MHDLTCVSGMCVEFITVTPSAYRVTCQGLFAVILIRNTCIESESNYVVHSPTNALFINLVKGIKFKLKYTIISLLHVSVFNDYHQGALSVPI